MFIENELRENGLFEPRKSEYGDYYGALWVAARYCGYSKIPGPIRGTWQHGHRGPEDNVYPEMVVGLRGNSFLNNPYQFVAREDQVTFLKSHGYKNVISVGLPFIYTGIPKADRSPGSVLIMPGHTLKEETNGSDYEEYVRFVEKLVEDFSQVVVCLHGIDYERGQARKAFERAGFPVIRGAAIEDSNSLDRMSFLFSRFEYVSTNLHGSHVYYAAARGCKVSIAGPPHIPDLDGLRKHVFYKNFPEGISYLPKKLALRRDANPFLYVSPRKAEPRIDWALNELGHHEKKSPQNLRKTLGWSPMQMFVTKQKQMLSNLINTLTLVKP